MSLDLTVLEQKSPIELFKDNGLDPVLEAITNEVKAFVPDLTTDKGRKEIASLAYKVSKSKTYLDDLGKDLVSEWKEQSKKVDNERKRVREYLDNLRDEVRKPLTEFEEREEARLQKHKDGIKAIESYLITYGAASNQETLIDAIKTLGAIDLTIEKWDEFSSLAQQKVKESHLYLTDLLDKRIKHDAEQAELEQLRKEKAEREKREHEERIAKEAAEKARIDAEAKAKADQDRLEKEKRESEQRENLLKQKLEKEKELAEKARIEAEKRAKEAVEKAKEDERLRIQRESERIELETRKREADLAHRKLINNAALDAIHSLDLGVPLPLEAARKIVEAIAKGEVPNVKINY